MRDKVLRFIREQNLIAPGSAVICAVSGGMDSVAMLHVLLSLREALQIRIEAAHVNHQLRAEASDRDEAFVRALCESWNVPLHVGSVDVAQRAKETGESTEEAARALRYQFLESLQMPVATAHTQDDNLETVLLNLIRGTGLRGLCGIPPQRGQFIRPLLCISRTEVEQYLQENHLPHMEDASNASDLYRRNRLRHTVVPLLRQENPAIGESIFRMSAILRQDEAYLDAQAASLLSRAQCGEGRWSCRVLREAPDAVRARAVRKIFDQLAVSKPAAAYVEAALRLISREDGSSRIALSGKLQLLREYDTLRAQKASAPAAFAARPLPADGVTEVPELGLVISCRIVKKYEKTSSIPCTFALKYDTISKTESLCVRPRRSGDAIALTGGTRSLKKLLIDRKVPAGARETVPVIADDQGVILVYPYAASHTRAAQPGEAAILIHIAHEKEYIQKEDT